MDCDASDCGDGGDSGSNGGSDGGNSDGGSKVDSGNDSDVCQAPPSDCYESEGTRNTDGQCVYAPKAAETPCADDGNSCTEDRCDGAGECVHPARADGTSCGTEGWECDAGVCVDPSEVHCPSFTSPLDLDPTGETIPDTDYPIPDGAIFMSTTGDDANDGKSINAPVRTLNRAIVAASAGGTIVLRGGIYRDWYHADGGGMYKMVPKSLTFQPYPHEQVWFDGTDVIPASSWKKNSDGTWSMAWSTPQFCNGDYYSRPITQQDTGSSNSGPCYHADMAGDSQNPMAGDPQMVFIDGKGLRQVASRAELAGSNSAFYYDHSNRVLYLGVDPAGKTVELAARPVALVLGGTPTVYVVRGLGFRRYATNEYHSLTGVAVYVGGDSESDKPAVVENCVFTRNAGGALYMRARGGIVRHTAMVFNGYTAMGSNGSSNKQNVPPDNLLIESNLVSDNNTESFGTNCNRSCGQAAIKIAHMNGFIVRYNILEKTRGKGSGFWCDLNCKNGVMVYNLVRDNESSGLYYEVSSDGIIASNMVYNNRRGINVTAAGVHIYNNTTINNYAHIYIYDDSRNAGNDKGTGPIPDTRDVDVFNNILYGGATYPLVAQQGARDAANDPQGLNTGPNEFMTGLDFNSYYRIEGPKHALIVWQDQTLDGNFKNFDELQALHPGLESHGHDISAPDPDPFFVNLDGGDYHISPDSVAWRSSKALPSKVSSALGLSDGAILNRGALCWPGSH